MAGHVFLETVFRSGAPATEARRHAGRQPIRASARPPHGCGTRAWRGRCCLRRPKHAYSPGNPNELALYAESLARKRQRMSIGMARRMLARPLYLAAAMVAAGDADHDGRRSFGADKTGDRGRDDDHRPGPRHQHAVQLFPDAAGRQFRPAGRCPGVRRLRGQCRADHRGSWRTSPSLPHAAGSACCATDRGWRCCRSRPRAAPVTPTGTPHAGRRPNLARQRRPESC